MGLLEERMNYYNEPVKEPEEPEPEAGEIVFNPTRSKNIEYEPIKPPSQETEEDLELYELEKRRSDAKRVRYLEIRGKVINIALVTACVYIIFLIYGVIMTNYAYDSTGNIAPMVLSVSDIREKKNFDVILVQYENARVLYEKILILDYRLGEGVETPISIAPEYEALLDEVETLSIKTNALDIDTRYQQVKEMILAWVSNDAAVYLQKMSSAISKNNADDANVAITYKQLMYNDFSMITENIAVMGDNINGVDLTEIKKWSPEGYIEDFIKGKE